MPRSRAFRSPVFLFLVAAVILTIFQQGSRAVATANTVPKWNGSGDLVESAITEVNGQVGIGTGNPGGLLSLGPGENGPHARKLLVIDIPAANAYSGWGHVTFEDRLFFPSDGHMSLGTISLSDGTTWSEKMRVQNDGRVGIGTVTPSTKLHVAGDITVDGNINAKWQDVAEWVDAPEALPSGTVVSIHRGGHNRVTRSAHGYDTAVAGVVSPRPGITLGERGPGKLLVAQSGRVRVKVDATEHAIDAGDLLVAGDVPGYAMRSVPVEIGGVSLHRPGTVLGKALESLKHGKGEILVLLTLQ